MKLLLRLKFLGTDFCGWQYQPNARTVQGTLTAAAREVFGVDCRITGCSRTDSGVHANDFAATLELPLADCPIPCARIPAAFAMRLPHDVSVTAAAPVADDFHPRYTVLTKEYVYKILVSPVPDPFLYGRVWHYPKKLLPDAAARMDAAAAALVGRHDFASFMAAGSKITDTVRTVSACRVQRAGDLIIMTIAADGFLYNMVRIIAGTLLLAGAGKLDAVGMQRILEAKNRAAAGATAPPEGLYLSRVTYHE